MKNTIKGCMIIQDFNSSFLIVSMADRSFNKKNRVDNFIKFQLIKKN